ncbi:MAG: hypothetical protein US54_C0059G0007 [Candidatus Roizmanbacteria bacterium GW2011_GWA2_37_7]|uniref:Endonuclease/exonuclease/phosphatase domain-containing protein n=1 Tax=Candidatus Roizmanbacteria bacterium GW2011_GWA2_37_7 TaxID=1618481 RepID=A0A0G0K7V6_9BACT|nr:MAG: hypothetical protein US54_C0059G0007 [Candidatus Roizmanbacteria bacterium GW2011_GWA2_37_7]
MHANIYGEVEKNLSNHKGYFATHLTGNDLNGTVNFPLESGLAIFIKKDIKVNESKEIFIYRSGTDLLHDDITSIPRNLQYISFSVNSKNYLIGHFHGIWFPKSKEDTEDRIRQSQKIQDFFAKRTEIKILCGDFNHAIQFCRENNFNKIKIETGKAFKQGHLFYKNRGFKIVKEDEEDFYMEKFL